MNQAEATGSRGGFSWKIGVLALICVTGIIFGRQAGRFLGEIVEWTAALGPWGGVLFGVLYAALTVALVPGSVLTLAAGAVYGVVWGSVIVFIGASAGSMLAFGVARYLARDWVERRLKARPDFAAVDEALSSEGLRIMFLLRLSPVFPFNFLNYALGLTRVTFRDYALACLGMIPGTILYVYTGAVAGLAARAIGGIGGRAAGGALPEKGAAWWALMGIGFIATVAVTVYATRLAKKALDQAVRSSPRPEAAPLP